MSERLKRWNRRLRTFNAVLDPLLLLISLGMVVYTFDRYPYAAPAWTLVAMYTMQSIMETVERRY